MSQPAKPLVELTPEDFEFASEQVAAGRYRDVGEATRRAFVVLRQHEQHLAKVRAEIDGLCADMDAGKGIDMTSAEFDEMVERTGRELIGG